MAWSMMGRLIETCSCELFCPCWFGPPAKPDQGWCSGAVVVDIEQGNSDSVDLNGLKVVFVGDWPGDFNLGNGTARLYIDETATVEQRRELEAICRGQKGGAWEVLAASITRWMPAQTADIEIQWTENPTVHVSNIGRITLQPLKDVAGQPTQLAGAAVMTALQLERLDLARSQETQFADPEMRQWSSGGSGDVSSFNWST
jgi:hypothetical protein